MWGGPGAVREGRDALVEAGPSLECEACRAPAPGSFSSACPASSARRVPPAGQGREGRAAQRGSPAAWAADGAGARERAATAPDLWIRTGGSDPSSPRKKILGLNGKFV